MGQARRKQVGAVRVTRRVEAGRPSEVWEWGTRTLRPASAPSRRIAENVNRPDRCRRRARAAAAAPLAVRSQLLESGRRDRDDSKILLLVARGRKNAYNLRTRFIRHLSNATLPPGDPSSEDRTSKDSQKRARRPLKENRKSTAPNCCESSWCWESWMPLRRRRLKKF